MPLLFLLDYNESCRTLHYDKLNSFILVSVTLIAFQGQSDVANYETESCVFCTVLQRKGN